jgi:magnesium chelatase subunit D
VNGTAQDPQARWLAATSCAALFAIDPLATGGIVLRARAGPLRDRWLALLRSLLPAGSPVRRVPAGIADGRLLGGLDLAATLRSGRPVAERGLLAEADGGVLILPMAERIAAGTMTRLTACLDSGFLDLQRDGVVSLLPARFGVIALDEQIDDEDAAVAGALRDRLAFAADIDGVRVADTEDVDALGPDAAAIAAARARLPGVEAPARVLEALCGAALAFGIASLRAPLLALRVARAAAALDGRDLVTDEDATLAAQLVYAARATRWPSEEPPQDEEAPQPQPEEPPPPDPDNEPSDSEQKPGEEDPLPDVILEAIKAAIPAGLLAAIKSGFAQRARGASAGRSGANRSGRRGRPMGARRGDLARGERLAVVETLRAAAPWQPLRRREAAERARRVEVRRDDFRVQRHRQRTSTTTVFVVDASGSAALHRLGEAKGAVELLLADCYVRRDQVALIAFRSRGAQLLLPPTRSLLRAKRALAGLPGGGGTPLASAIDAAVALVDNVRRHGDTPLVVLLTDGRANVARDGNGGREAGERDALHAARLARAARFATLFIDTAQRPQATGRTLAEAMGAQYLALPHADSAALSRAVRAVRPAA